MKKFSVVELLILFTSLLILKPNLGAAQTVSADFGSRANTAFPIIGGSFLLGAGKGPFLSTPSAVSLARDAGFTKARISFDFASVPSSGILDFSVFDQQMAELTAGGLAPLIIVWKTPKYLQPTSGPCPVANRDQAPPTNLTAWSALAASLVHHVDTKFPNTQAKYEIWNEPDANICTGTTLWSDKLNAYLPIFSAAAKAMRAQAATDGKQMKVGGPGLAGALWTGQKWVNAMVTDPRTYPYVDFISYHVYVTGAVEINSGMTWNGTVSLFGKTQDPTTGIATTYLQTSRTVAAGLQTDPTHTPIYITEYNDNWAHLAECCRNKPVYGPLWNSVAVVDLLNTVYSGASHVPSVFGYFSATYDPTFCLFGLINQNMDCNQSVLSPYPQYWSYKLLASSEYLQLSQGGYMAKSHTTPSPFLVTAFRTATYDSIVIVNPMPSNFSTVTVSFTNPGFSAPHSKSFVLDGANPNIGTFTETLKPITGGFQTTVTVPPYSTVAVTIY